MLLLVPLLLAGCVGAGVDVGGYYPGYYYGDPYYYGSDVGVYYYNNSHYYGHPYHHYNSGYSHVASNATIHGGTHFTGTRTASVSSYGHTSGASHASSAHVSASVRQ